MTERYLDLNGTTLFVDDRGEADAPALLYVHGGPGMSAFDFMATIGDRLAADLRVVGLDHRGVLRSGPIGDAPLTTRTLVQDFEAARELLGIDSWAVLGHSAGGVTALDYATWHPGTVRGVVFDCPCWDADSTDRHRLPVVADRLDERGKHEAAQRCRELAGLARRLTAADQTHEAMQALEDDYLDLFFHDPAARKRFEATADSSGFGEETWERGTSHAPLMEEMYVDRLPRLGELEVPSMLVHGVHDLVTTPHMVDCYRASVAGGAVHTLDASAHFPYHEQPQEYLDLVVGFVKKVTP